MGGHAGKNPCKECVYRIIWSDQLHKLGSGWHNNFYFFILDGKQFYCKPKDSRCYISKNKKTSFNIKS